MAEENRREIVADALRPVLDEGEGYNVYCHEGEVHVYDAETSVCASKHPKLYGRLLSVSGRLDQAGAGWGRLPLLLTAIFCVGIRLHWWNEFLGADVVAQLDSIWFYLLVFYVVIQVLTALGNALQRGIYRAEREELYRALAREGLDRDLLLAMINEDAEVARVTHYLKLDRSAPPL